MKIKSKLLTLLFLLLFLACKSYLPFESKQDKKASVALIKNKITLSTKEYNIIKKNDSVLYAISNAVKVNVKPNLIERRIDSFVNKNYTSKEMLMILKLDSIFPNQRFPFELDRRKGKNRLELNNVDELKRLMNGGGLEKQLDSVLGMKQKVKDSTKRKKEQ